MVLVKFYNIRGKQIYVNPDRVDCVSVTEDEGVWVFVGGSDEPVKLAGSVGEITRALMRGVPQ